MTNYEKEHWEHTVDSLGRPLGRLSEIEVNDRRYRILPMTQLKDRVYENTLLPTLWGVFVQNKGANCWQQITPWYARYGYAVNVMVKFTKNHESEVK